MHTDSTPRIFIGLVEIAGFYGRLAAGFQEIGARVTVADLSGNPFAYVRPEPPAIVRWAERTARFRERTASSGIVLRAVARLTHRLALMALFAWALMNHDAFIFAYRTTFLWFVDLPVLKLLRKRVIYVFNGSDARPSYIDGADTPPEAFSVEQCVQNTRRKRREIRRIERWADEIVAHPLYLHLFRRPAAGIQLLGIPTPPSGEVGAPSRSRTREFVQVLHAPSNRAVKGTSLIRSAIAELEHEGVPVRLVELHGVSNTEIRRAISDCDFVVDQAYSDLPMSVFALEAAVAGKPAVVGSYGWREIEATIPIALRPPVEASHPDELKASIRRLVVDPDYRKDLGDRAQRFVRNWSAARVAQRYMTLIDGEAPAEWFSRPEECAYLHGVGMSEDRARDVVSAVIDVAGPEGLALSHRPDLARRFVAFSRRGSI